MKRSFLLYLANHIVAHLPSRRIRIWFYRRWLGVRIGAYSAILMGVSFDSIGSLEIGSRSVVNGSCRLDNRGGLVIGNNVSISTGTTILTADHDLRESTFLYRERSVVIEDYAFLGSNCIILPGVRIGRGAIVGAGAIVTRSVDDLAIVAGNPAKIIGQRPASALGYELQFFPALR